MRHEAVLRDLALSPEGRGERKLIVTEIYQNTEAAAAETDWQPPERGERCQVLLMNHTEAAVFNQYAKQTSHRHEHATEIYTVIEGAMHIDVAQELYELQAGDVIAVRPGICHEVKRTGSFTCWVFCIDCDGKNDRIEC